MRYYLGLDLSTQGLKAVFIDPESGELLTGGSVNFGRDLPQFGCPDGFLPGHGLERHADPLMWVAALDLLLTRMQAAGMPLGLVKAVSGSGQQHGSVYLNSRFATVAKQLNPAFDLAGQLADTLSRKTAPIWMDASTAAECRALEKSAGARLRTDTGSAATERFTAAQIAKFYRTDPKAYRETRYIHLVSSFMASVLAGLSAAVDPGDGAGMNLLNLKTGKWDGGIADAVAPGLVAKLPQVAAADRALGAIHPYFMKYGFSPSCQVAVWSGDNPSSLVGVGATTPGTAVISLGTSDTFFGAMRDFTTDPAGYGHVFGNPAGGFMSLTCFTNGSLAREEIRRRYQVEWAEAGDLIRKEPPGNNGNRMLSYIFNEITPKAAAGVVLEGDAGFVAGHAAPGVYLRALFEAQALRLKLHSQWLGQFERLRLTGGASRDQALMQIIADVFQVPVETLAITDSAALGSAIRAANAADGCDFEALYRKFSRAEKTVTPDLATASVYAEALAAYASSEKRHLG